MGTNYYARTNGCECCNRYDELHIGKSSAGWCFALHIIPDMGLTTLDAWKNLLAQPRTQIRNEYGDSVTVSELLSAITERACGEKGHSPTGYKDWEHFHHSNYSEDGPNGLLRHQIGPYCAGHGEGTWDLIEGEFR